MALPASGAISLGDIRTELGLSGTITLDDSAVRNLAGKTTPGSSVIVPTDFYGKSNTPSVVPTYSFSTVPSSIDEGNTGSFNLTTTDVSNGTTLYWTINNISTSDADFYNTTGSFNISSNTGSFFVGPVPDATTEGAQTFTVSVRTGSTSGTVVATSSTVTVNDTSTTPSAATIPNAPTIGTAIATSGTTATVSFTEPVNNGGATITSYTATSSPGGITGTVNQSGGGTITITGLTSGVSYTFVVRATNSAGTSDPSGSSNSISMPSVSSVVSVLPGFTGSFNDGTWYVNSRGGDSPSSAEMSVIIRRNGTFSLNFNFSVNYIDPDGAPHTTGSGSTYPVITGDWVSPKTSSVGDSYYVRLSGRRRINATGARLDGYNSTSDIVSPTLFNGIDNNDTYRYFWSSPWLQLNSDRGIFSTNGGAFTGAVTSLWTIKLEIATDSAGSNIVSTSNLGTYYLGTAAG